MEWRRVVVLAAVSEIMCGQLHILGRKAAAAEQPYYIYVYWRKGCLINSGPFGIATEMDRSSHRGCIMIAITKRAETN